MGSKELEMFRAELERQGLQVNKLDQRVDEAKSVAETADRRAFLAGAAVENMEPQVRSLLDAARQLATEDEGTTGEYLSACGGPAYRVVLWLMPDGQVQATLATGLVVISPSGVWLSGHVNSVYENPNETLEGIIASLAERAAGGGAPF